MISKLLLPPSSASSFPSSNDQHSTTEAVSKRICDVVTKALSVIDNILKDCGEERKQTFADMKLAVEEYTAEMETIDKELQQQNSKYSYKNKSMRGQDIFIEFDSSKCNDGEDNEKSRIRSFSDDDDNDDDVSDRDCCSTLDESFVENLSSTPIIINHSLNYYLQPSNSFTIKDGGALSDNDYSSTTSTCSSVDEEEGFIQTFENEQSSEHDETSTDDPIKINDEKSVGTTSVETESEDKKTWREFDKFFSREKLFQHLDQIQKSENGIKELMLQVRKNSKDRDGCLEKELEDQLYRIRKKGCEEFQRVINKYKPKLVKNASASNSRALDAMGYTLPKLCSK